MQFGQPRRLDPAEQADTEVFDVGLAALDPIDVIRAAVECLQPESSVGGRTATGGVFLHASDPARNLVALDQQSSIGPGKDVRQLLDRDVRADQSRRARVPGYCCPYRSLWPLRNSSARPHTVDKDNPDVPRSAIR